MSIKQLIQKDITLRTEDMNEGIIEININSKPVLYLQRINRPDVKSPNSTIEIRIYEALLVETDVIEAMTVIHKFEDNE